MEASHCLDTKNQNIIRKVQSVSSSTVKDNSKQLSASWPGGKTDHAAACCPQQTFREVLTMLAAFDCIFISSAVISFSLPLLSPYWKVKPYDAIKHSYLAQQIKNLKCYRVSQDIGHP